jgi:serine/threonine-protein kinase SRPK3
MRALQVRRGGHLLKPLAPPLAPPLPTYSQLPHLLRHVSSMTARAFIPSRLDGIEDVEEYRPGGYHPISIGDVFGRGRYKVIHKLGFGGSSTVWLARDLQEEPQRRFVALKAMRADASSKSPGGIPELSIPNRLRTCLSGSARIQAIDHHFFEDSPNGSHLFLVSPFAGPSVLAMSDSPGRVAGSRRLRADLARKVAKQVATTLYHMHSAGIVHGGERTLDILTDTN